MSILNEMNCEKEKKKKIVKKEIVFIVKEPEAYSAI